MGAPRCTRPTTRRHSITAASTAPSVRDTNSLKILGTVVVVFGRRDPWRNPIKLSRRPTSLGPAVAKPFAPTILSNFRTLAHPQTISRPNWSQVIPPFCWKSELPRKPSTTATATTKSSYTISEAVFTAKTWWGHSKRFLQSSLESMLTWGFLLPQKRTFRLLKDPLGCNVSSYLSTSYMSSISSSSWWAKFTPCCLSKRLEQLNRGSIPSMDTSFCYKTSRMALGPTQQATQG
jgi:hypothetical protein